ncbi:type II toxin-antitoxin system HicB family antitoxin [Chelatococcus sambhunathii]|uniref:Type II toxin-antitoxin system HicB family antitoxin n=1 Tax=Chelatococcus sambhunathii TaxID=363953 RepID=A0ABU1DH97_9HYPH|nr:type II toxin-antitoxin system HicB family antitoxin [Chelatococcus sambhunathii]MDR4307497.1 type II toxin-antitoxin system HicB family antitoxin [Chelatococcus sambhunathii]
MKKYIALIHREGDAFGVSFPDLPGCVTVGGSIEEAQALAEEALALHLEGMVEDGEAAPEPSSLDAVMTERENRDAVAVLVQAPKGVVRAVRVSVTFPEDLLQQIDAYAERNGFTRSGFLQLVAKEAMQDESRLRSAA